MATTVSTECIGERQPLGDASTTCVAGRFAAPAPPAARRIVGVRLDQDQLLEPVRVVAQVQAGAGAELDHAPARAASSAPPAAAQSRQLAECEGGVVDEANRRGHMPDATVG